MKCQYCGSSKGMLYKDDKLDGFLCLDPNCGRFNEFLQNDMDIYDSDM